MEYRLGVDIGGTFTDFAILNESSDRLATDKPLTNQKSRNFPINGRTQVTTGYD